MAVKTCAVTAPGSGEAATITETGGTTALNGSTDTINITGGADADRLVLIISNTTAATKKATIKAGNAAELLGSTPPALRKGRGDLVVTMLQKTLQMITVESARHANSDGTITCSFEAAMEGFITAVRLPKAA